MVKKFDGNEGKIVREGNFYILNFEKYIKISDEKIKIQIVNLILVSKFHLCMNI